MGDETLRRKRDNESFSALCRRGVGVH